MLNIFLAPMGHLYVFFVEVSIQILFLFFNQTAFMVFSQTSSFHILDSNFLWDVCFANIFSHSVRYLFVLMIVSFTVHKLLRLMQYYLPISYCHWSWMQKGIANINVKGLIDHDLFYSFRSLFHFGLAFVCRTYI